MTQGCWDLGKSEIPRARCLKSAVNTSRIGPPRPPLRPLEPQSGRLASVGTPLAGPRSLAPRREAHFWPSGTPETQKWPSRRGASATWPSRRGEKAILGPQGPQIHHFEAPEAPEWPSRLDGNAKWSSRLDEKAILSSQGASASNPSTICSTFPLGGQLYLGARAPRGSPYVFYHINLTPPGAHFRAFWP